MKQETINICPSWRGIANTCIMILEVGNEEAKQVAKEEIRRMGAILDGEFKQGAKKKKKDSHQPAQDSANSYCHEVIIDSPCKVIYSPDKPLPCGAKVWIETEGNIICT